MLPQSLPQSNDTVKDSSCFLPRTGEQAHQRGLSTPHISAENVSEPVFCPSSSTAWIDGALFKVQKSGYSIPQVGGGERGEVGEFNRSQRLRALRMLAKTDREADNCFYTLTYSDAFSEQVCLSYAGAYNAGRKVKRDLNTWNRRVTRDYPGLGVFWRVETIDRKSGEFVGEVFPHIHGFLWGVDNLQEIRAWLSHTWAEVAAAGAAVDPKHVDAGTQVQQPDNWLAVMAYASKMVYATKPGDSQLKGIGRWWGAFNRDAIPWSATEESQICDRAGIMLYRSARKYLERHTKSPWVGHGRSLTIFTCDPVQWARLGQYYQSQVDDQQM